jgi:hypothetical protein
LGWRRSFLSAASIRGLIPKIRMSVHVCGNACEHGQYSRNLERVQAEISEIFSDNQSELPNGSS